MATRFQLKALFRQVITVVAGGPNDKTRGGTLISALDEFVDSAVVPADLPALLVTNKLRGTSKQVQNMVQRTALETAAVLSAGTDCYVQNSASEADFLLGVIAPPKRYVVSRNDTLVAPAGFLAYIDGSATSTTARCEWVEAGTFDAEVAVYPYIDLSQSVALGFEGKYLQGTLRLFKALQAMVPAGGPPAVVPAPTGLPGDAYWEEISPAAGATYTDQQAMVAAYTERFQTTTRAALLLLANDGVYPKPGKMYRLTDSVAGEVMGVFATFVAPFMMEYATVTGQTGLYRYDLTNDVATPLSGLPSQTGNNSKVLTTDGTVASWANAPAGYTDSQARAAALQAVPPTATIQATYNVGTEQLSLSVRTASLDISHFTAASIGVPAFSVAQKTAVANAANWSGNEYIGAESMLTVLDGAKYATLTYLFQAVGDGYIVRTQRV